ncbi:MAG: class I SAM-dependent methyltransferase [Porphyrobacter sp.]|nr:class I SAM-dependent methyltransferase [Porphyrobacter sp.]
MGLAFARLALATLLLVGASACDRTPDDSDRPETSREFPRAYRPAPQGGSAAVSSEEVRDDRNEAVTVMDLANIEPGMTVADIGAGDGYYTVRLAERVGPGGRVLAQDIDRDALARLGRRVEDERLDNVSIKLGAPDDPNLPPNSFDRIFLVDMYHEVEEPYAFLWRLRPALAEGGQVIVVDVGGADKHGISPELLFCEFQQVGFRLVEFVRKPELAGYYARFEAVGPRPEPGDIQPCKGQGTNGEASS